MPLLVTMHVYSGVPDPQWVISGDDEQELRRLVASPAAASAAAAQEGVLGYRGFSVVDTAADPAAPHLFKVQAAAGAVPSHSIAGAPEIEHFLLWTGHKHVSDELSTHVQAALQTPIGVGPAAAPVRCPPCQAHDAPVYTPAAWNHPPVQANNNCYNYANNQITNTFAQPGRATGHMYTSLTCASVRAAAQSDGLVPCPNFIAPLAAGAGWYVALVIWPGQDYHWYRQDKSGCWSHKPGGTPARNTDNSGHLISNPRTCNRGPYTVFCTFMITRRTVHIR
ncbi:MAG TPA: hypothetical protein VMU06_18540 [Stellaceae bacterium]|nr:hypothetical protein [Stellaceae bacterium]